MKFGLDNYTMLIECEPYKMELSENLEVDEYSILSILVMMMDLHSIHLSDLNLKLLHQVKNV